MISFDMIRCFVMAVWSAGEMFLNISIYVGNIVVHTGLEISIAFFGLITSIIDFCLIFINDYVYFMADVHDKLHKIGETMLLPKSFLVDTGSSLITGFASCMGMAMRAGQTLKELMAYILELVLRAVIFLHEGFSFLGSAVVTIFFELPLEGLRYLYNLPCFCSNGFACLNKTFSFYIIRVIADTKLAAQNLVSWFQDNNPCYSLVGLIAACIIIYLTKCYFHILLNCGGRTISGAKVLLANFWAGMRYENTPGTRLIENEHPGLAGPTRNDLDGSIVNCIICLDSPRNILFLPCRHTPCCKSCSNKLNSNLCPLCRKKVTKSMLIYF